MKKNELVKPGKKLCLIWILLSVAFGQLFAQNYSIKGKLTDEENGQPLSGVNVMIQGTNKGAISDSTGTFIISGLQNKLYDVAFSSVGFRSKRQTILAGTEVTAVEMSVDATALQSVEVYGKKKVSPLNDPTIQP